MAEKVVVAVEPVVADRKALLSIVVTYLVQGYSFLWADMLKAILDTSKFDTAGKREECLYFAQKALNGPYTLSRKAWDERATNCPRAIADRDGWEQHEIEHILDLAQFEFAYTVKHRKPFKAVKVANAR